MEIDYVFSLPAVLTTLAVAAAMITVFGGLGHLGHSASPRRALSPFGVEKVTLLRAALESPRT